VYSYSFIYIDIFIYFRIYSYFHTCVGHMFQAGKIVFNCFEKFKPSDTYMCSEGSC